MQTPSGCICIVAVGTLCSAIICSLVLQMFYATCKQKITNKYVITRSLCGCCILGQDHGRIMEQMSDYSLVL